jgi:hypothetical protein
MCNQVLCCVPVLSCVPCVVQDIAIYLNTDLRIPKNIGAERYGPAFKEFLDKLVRKNMPDLGLPPILASNVWVEMSPSERLLYQDMGRNDFMNSLMACNHFHLARYIYITSNIMPSFRSAVLSLVSGNDSNLTIAQASHYYFTLTYRFRAYRSQRVYNEDGFD